MSKSLRHKICPGCGQIVEGGRIALLGNGGWAHWACKEKEDQVRRDSRAGARARDRARELTKNLDEAMAKGHEAVAELLKKG